MSLHHHCDMSLPVWVDEFVGHWLNERGASLDTVEHRMQLAVALSAENVRQETGGPSARSSWKKIRVGWLAWV